MTEQRTNPGRSARSAATDVLAHLSNLLRGEVDLARAEISENIHSAVMAIGLIVGALVIALTALNVLAAALVAAITNIGLDAAWSSLIVGAVLGIIALILAMSGSSKLKLASLAPTRTGRNIRRDAETGWNFRHAPETGSAPRRDGDDGRRDGDQAKETEHGS